MVTRKVTITYLPKLTDGAPTQGSENELPVHTIPSLWLCFKTMDECHGDQLLLEVGRRNGVGSCVGSHL